MTPIRLLTTLFGWVCLLLAGCAVESHVAPSAATDVSYQSRLNDTGANALFHYSRGQMLLDDGQPAAAVEAYLQALRLDPQADALRFELAEIHLRLG